MSRHHHHNLSQVCWYRQHEPNVNDTEKDHHISENRTDFDRELLGLQATHGIAFILFGIVTTRAFQRVVGGLWAQKFAIEVGAIFQNMMVILCIINIGLMLTM